MQTLSDTDPMPFGQHKGKPMQDVPASYLHWLWTNDRDPMSQKVKVDRVADYIHRNLACLQREHPDGIWS
jgi:uncharacterized protein (DUF3820 family)